MKNYFISAYIMAVCYGIGAFINWDVNAGNWTEFARLTVVLIWLLISILWASYEAERKTMRDNK
jgi:uncharacterized membrane protein